MIIFLICMIFMLGCKEPKKIVLKNANVIDLETGKAKLVDLIIQNNTIISISNKTVIPNDSTIDLKGKYLIPTLWDMHVHLHGDRDKLMAFYKHGVLGIRDLGGFKTEDIDSLMKWKQETSLNSSIKYPDIYYAGHINNDTTCYNGHRNVTTYKELIESSLFLSKIGSSFYKVHNCFPDELLPKLDSLASIHNFVIGGHIPEGIGPIQYVTQFDNINSVEHVSVLLRALSFRNESPLNMMEAVEQLDGPYLDSLSSIMKEKNISFTPNLLSEMEFIKSYPEEKKKLGEGLFRKLNEFTKRISDNGVNILAGTDTGLDFEAGKSLYQELDLLSQAGLSNLEVLRSATINAERALGRSPNLIKENSEANFIILKDNPLENLSTLRLISGIVHNGNYVKFETD